MVVASIKANVGLINFSLSKKMKNVVRYRTQWLCHISRNSIDRLIPVLSSRFLKSNTSSSLSFGVVQTLLARCCPLPLSLFAHMLVLSLSMAKESQQQ
jgi:hypothetical protein